MLRELFGTEYLLLDDWLSVATKGLSDESAARVVEEIREHYDQSVAALVSEGYRPGGAELETIRRLGSPHRARRGYRREYVTQQDMKVLDRYHDELDTFRELGKRLSWREIYSVGCLLFFALTLLIEGPSEAIWILPMCGFTVATSAFAGRAAVRTTHRRGHRRGLETYRRVMTISSSLLSVLFFVLYIRSDVYLVVLPLLPVVFFLTMREHRIWKKLRPLLGDK